MSWLARNWKGKRAQVSSLHTKQRELTSKMMVGNRPIKAPVGTGASVSHIRTDAYNQLKIEDRTRRPDLAIDQAEGRKSKLTRMGSEVSGTDTSCT